MKQSLPRRGAHSALSKIAWNLLLAASTAAASAVAAVFARELWRLITNEPPPGKLAWYSKLPSKKVKNGILGAMGAPQATKI